MKECSRRPEKRGILLHAEWRDWTYSFPGARTEAELPPASFCDLLLKRSRSAEREAARSGLRVLRGWEGPWSGRGWPGLRIRHPGAGHHTTALQSMQGCWGQRTHYAVLCGSLIYNAGALEMV